MLGGISQTVDRLQSDGLIVVQETMLTAIGPPHTCIESDRVGSSSFTDLAPAVDQARLEHELQSAVEQDKNGLRSAGVVHPVEVVDCKDERLLSLALEEADFLPHDGVLPHSGDPRCSDEMPIRLTMPGAYTFTVTARWS